MTTKKDKNNTLHNLNTSLTKQFLSKNNLKYLSNRLYSEYLINGGKMSNIDFNNNIIEDIIPFVKNNDLNNIEMVHEHAMGFKDYSELLEYINSKFINKFKNRIPSNTYNPYKDAIPIVQNGEIKFKNIYDIMPDDYNSMLSWKETSVYCDNSNFRDRNKIPYRQVMLQNRHFDKYEYTINRTLESPVYKYDMRNFTK